ncbi:hypothetical protein ACTXT7_007830 [Hymenolepis weldensis]
MEATEDKRLKVEGPKTHFDFIEYATESIALQSVERRRLNNKFTYLDAGARAATLRYRTENPN